MATSAGKAILDVEGRFDDVNKKGEEAAQQLGGVFKSHLGSALKLAAGGFAGYQIKQFADESVKEAQNVEAGLSRTTAIFGGFHDSVVKWSEGTAKSMGLSEAASLKMADAIGLRLVSSLGYSQEAAAKLSPKMVGLASDIAKFNRVDIDTASDAIQRALLGQTRGLKSLGIAISNADVQRKAEQMGLVKHGQALDANAKAQATYQLILEQTKLQQGQTERSSHTLASATQRSQAEYEDLQGMIGEKMLPTLTKQANFQADVLIPGMTKLTEKMFAVPGAGQAMVGSLTAVAFTSEHATQIASGLSIATTAYGAAAKVAGLGSKVMGGALTVLKAPFLAAIAQSWAFTASLLANPIVLIIVALLLLVGVFVLLYFKCKPFHDLVDMLFGKLREGFQWVTQHWRELLPLLLGPLGIALGLLAFFGPRIWAVIGGPLLSILGWIRDHWQLIVTMLTNPLGFVLLAVQQFGPRIVAYVTAGLEALVRSAQQTGERMVHGLQSGIGGAWSAFVKFFTDKINLLPAGVRKILGISSPSRVFRDIMQDTIGGAVLGVEDRRRHLLDAVRTLGEDMQSAFQPTLAVAGAGIGAANVSTRGPAPGAGGVSIVQNINQPGADANSIAKAMGWELSRRGLR